jgi:hypothetical protein
VQIEVKELVGAIFLTIDEIRSRYEGEIVKKDKMILELEANGREKEILRNAYNELQSRFSMLSQECISKGSENNDLDKSLKSHKKMLKISNSLVEEKEEVIRALTEELDALKDKQVRTRSRKS